MKAFVIFPAICIFALILTMLKLSGQVGSRTALLWSTIVTILFAGLMMWFSVDVFSFLYYANFFGVIVLIPCLTYLTNKVFNDNKGKGKWMRLLGLGFVSAALTIAIFALSIFFSLANNPMDPGPRQIEVIK